MDTLNDVQITVTGIDFYHDFRVDVVGLLDYGIVRMGDVLQVHNHQDGATVRVVHFAMRGNEIRLALLGLVKNEIHPGDKLLPGLAGDLRLADREAWEKLPERIRPIINIGQSIDRFVGPVFDIIVVIGSFLLGIWFVMKNHINMKYWFLLVPLILLLGGFGVLAYQNLKKLFRELDGGKMILRRQSQTVARILSRHIVKHNDNNAYLLQVEFTPSAQFSTGDIRAEVSVSRTTFEALWKNNLANITYAVEAPRIFIVEGE